MPNVTVYNLTGNAIVLPGGYYVDPIEANQNATFEVIDTDEFVKIPSVVDMVNDGHIRIELEDDSVDLRPVMVVADAAALAALTPTDYPEGFIVAVVAPGSTNPYLVVQLGGAFVGDVAP